MPDMKNSNTSDEQNSSLPQIPENGNPGETNAPSDSSGIQGQFPNGGNNMQPPQNNGELPQDGNIQGFPQGDNGQEMIRPDNKDEQMENQVRSRNRNSYIILGVCTVVLLAGLLFALLYQKRA